MITLYSKATSNGRKASIMLEESGLDYKVRPIDLEKNEQKENWYLEINPNGRIPCIVDHDGPGGESVTLFESGSILIYLAEKTGRLIPSDRVNRIECLNWLFFSSGHITHSGLAVMWQVRAREKGADHPHLFEWQEEHKRVYRVLEEGLKHNEFLAGVYSIADISAWPWILRHQLTGVNINMFPNVKRWFNKVAERPAVKRGMQIPPRKDGL